MASTVTPAQTSRVATVDGQSVVQINEGFDSAWRRVGLALDRTGFTVEDRDRSAGTYFVRYVPPNPDKDEAGFFSKILSIGKSGAGTPPLKYRIVVKSQDSATTVSVQNETGGPAAAADAQNITKVIAADLK